MRTIASTLMPDSIPEHVAFGGIAYTKSALVGAEVFSIQSVWLPLPEKMNEEDRTAFALTLDAIASECLAGDFVKQPLPSEESAHTYLVPTTQQIEVAVRKYCESETSWQPSEETIVELAPAYQSLGLRFAKTVVEAPNIVIQQSPPTLIALATLFSKAKEYAPSATGVWVGMEAAKAGHVASPGLYLLYVGGGILLCGSALPMGAAIAKLVEAVTKKLVRKI
jgi:hypothetical protein